MSSEIFVGAKVLFHDEWHDKEIKCTVSKLPYWSGTQWRVEVTTIEENIEGITIGCPIESITMPDELNKDTPRIEENQNGKTPLLDIFYEGEVFLCPKK